DLDRDVEADAGELAPERLDQRQGVADAVEEVRIAEADVTRAGFDLRANVGHHHVDGNDSEAPVVDRHDRTVPAHVLAAAGTLRVADRPPLTTNLQARISRERRQPRPIRRPKRQPRNRRCRPDLQVGRGANTPLSIGPGGIALLTVTL